MTSYSSLIDRIKDWSNHYQRTSLGTPLAGVLIPLFQHQGEPHLILTLRSKKLNHHAGQISFPGGKIDASDSSIEDTVLRETEEEIGIGRSNITIINKFHDFSTPWFKCVTPIFGTLNKNRDYTISQDEIDEIIEVPLKDLLLPFVYHTEIWVQDSFQVRVHFYYWRDPKTDRNYNIWGAIASVIHQFLSEIVKRINF
ncbi:MAG: CoA pyrophosphatase [Candidatus Heimdallarchaeota archaeon]|nr:CoA pyrophosphatase [Candidatus Heimdallarchaeota archaeon]